MRRKIFALTVFLLVTQALLSQEYYPLSFVLNPDTDSEVAYVYPENTAFDILGTSNNHTSVSQDEELILDGAVTAIVHTSWSDQPDVLRANFGMSIQQNRVYITDHPDKIDSETASSHYGAYSGSVSVLKKTLIEEGQEYGLEISFSNGISFFLLDGQAKAYEQEREIPIAGKYRILSTEGILSLSFNQATGEIWYYFEPKN